MAKVKLVRPNHKMMYSGIFLDLWKGYDILEVIFSNDNNKYHIQYVDGTHRYLGGYYPKKYYLTQYWNLIRRGWKPLK
jgi:hypothetical protein